MHILIVGGTGFIGKSFAQRALADGCTVRILSRHANESNVPQGAAYIAGDIADTGTLDAATKDVEICLQCASTTTPATANQAIAHDIGSNLIGSVQLLQSCRDAGVKRFLFLSSGGTVYGDPVTVPIAESHPTEPKNSYGIVKLAIEKYVAMFHQQYGLDYRIARVSNVYGPGQKPNTGQGVIATFIDRIVRNEPLKLIGTGEVVRDFVYIDDAVEALMRLCATDSASRIFNIGAGTGTSINEVISIISKAAGHQPVIERLPPRSLDVSRNILGCDLARKELGWTAATSIASGIEKTVEAYS